MGLNLLKKKSGRRTFLNLPSAVFHWLSGMLCLWDSMRELTSGNECCYFSGSQKNNKQKNKNKKWCTTPPWFGKSAPSWLLICITRSTDSWDNTRWMDGWMFKCRSRLICSVVSYYICQMKSFWLQIQCTNVQTKRKCSFLKTSGSLFFLNKETAIGCVKEHVYI